MTVTYRQLVENGQKGDSRSCRRCRRSSRRRRSSASARYANPNWDELAECESGGRWDTVDRRPRRLRRRPRHLPGTWRAFGGAEFAPNAGLATREQQIIVGMRIYEKLGLGPVGLREQRAALAAVEHVIATDPWGSADADLVVSTSMALLTPATVHALLDEHGLHPKRSLGQNFLADPNTARRIVALADAAAPATGARDRSRPRLAHARAARRRCTTSSRSSSTTGSPTCCATVLADDDAAAVRCESSAATR